MTTLQTNHFFPVVAAIVHSLGPTWGFTIADNATQIIAFPIDRTVHLRFAKAGGAAPAIAVELVDEQGSPVDVPLDPLIWLLPFDMASTTAARQIKGNMIVPYRACLKVRAAVAA